MTVGDLKTWLSKLPNDLNNVEIIFREFDSKHPEENDHDLYYTNDHKIISGYIDTDQKEMYFIDEKMRNFIIEMNEKGEELDLKNMEESKPTE